MASSPAGTGRALRAIAAGLILAAATAATTRAATLPAGFTEVLVAGDLGAPTAMAFAPDGRLFVCSQDGDLRIVKDGALLPDPFVSVDVDDDGERGLLGVAFDPDFATNHFVYVYYTAPTTPRRNRVSRFTADGDAAVPGSEEVLLNLDPLSSARNHNGGAIHFGPDGKLYVAVGENAEPANSQTTSNMLGKVLRLNADGTSPADNPFGGSAAARRIWALGLRNPFTFAFQPGTGRLFINDVGQNTWEEINDGQKGANYGWPESEGRTSNPDHKGPIFTYLHGPGGRKGCAITGGTFYNPGLVQFPPEYVGSYFFSDLCNGWIRRFDPAAGRVSPFAQGIENPVDLQVGPEGALYYLQRGTASVWRVQFGDGTPNTPPVGTIQEPPGGTLYAAGDTIQYAGSGTDAEDGALAPGAFTWQVDFHHDGESDVFVPPTTGSETGSFTIPTSGNPSTDVFYRILLTVRDSGGATHTSSRDVLPRLVTLTLSTAPAGLQVTLDGQPVTAPADVESVVGMRRVLGPVSPQTSGGTTYTLASWSDGGAATHTIATPASDTAFTATYTAATPAGIGLQGFYYANTDFTGAVRTRLDPTVDFTWDGAPIEGIAANTFSVRWTGQVRATVTGTHTFFTTTDGGVRLFVNGVAVIRNYTVHPTTEDSGTIELNAGELYDVRLEYFDTAGTAVARLEWSGPGLTREVVPRQSLYPYALLVVGSTTPSVDDAAVRDRLVAGGFVPVLRAGTVTADKAVNQAVVVISATAAPGDVLRRLRTAATPVIVAEPELFDEMGMTTGAAAEGTVGSQTQITIVDGAHPLAAGFSGDVDVTTEPATLSWGAPAAGAVVVARAAGSTTRGTLFAYERGARMVGLNAPARRVGFFLHEQTASLLTPDGQALLDAALRWATGQ